MFLNVVIFGPIAFLYPQCILRSVCVSLPFVLIAAPLLLSYAFQDTVIRFLRQRPEDLVKVMRFARKVRRGLDKELKEFHVREMQRSGNLEGVPLVHSSSDETIDEILGIEAEES